MSTLYDRVLRYGLDRDVRNVVASEEFVSGLASATVLKIDNVAEYFFSGSNQEYWNLFDDFPSVAPPWPNVFIEFTLPRQSISKDVGVIDFPMRPEFGVKFTSFKVSDLQADPATPVPKEVISREIEWITTATLVASLGHRIWADHSAAWGVLKDGTPTGLKGDRDVVCVSYTENRAALPIPFLVAALAICFCNCAKTKLTEHVAPPKLSRSHERKCGKPLVRYHTVEIEAVNRVLKAAVGSGAGIKQALHICRGHFKDYRERGLFGKVKGVFWWDMSVRGSADEGVVVKDYQTVGGVR
jgi:hypothetical protein